MGGGKITHNAEEKTIEVGGKSQVGTRYDKSMVSYYVTIHDDWDLGSMPNGPNLYDSGTCSTLESAAVNVGTSNNQLIFKRMLRDTYSIFYSLS